MKNTIVDSTNFNDGEILAYSGNYLYGGSWEDNSITIWDITIPASPTFVTSIIDATLFNEPNYMTVSGNYAYVVAQGQFTILDITNSASPTKLGSILIGDSNYHWDHMGNAVIDENTNFAYVPATYDNGLVVVDISDKNNPTIHASISGNDSLEKTQGVAKSGNYLYLTLRNTGNAFTVVDVSDPANPAVVASITDGDDPYTSDTFNLRDIILDETNDIAYVSTNNIANENAQGMITAIDISTPASPVIISSTRDAAFQDGFEFGGIINNGQYMIGSTSEGPGIVAFDISDPSNLVVTDSLSLASLWDGGAMTLVDDDYAYVSSYTEDTFYVVSTVPPAASPLQPFALNAIVDDDTQDQLLLNWATYQHHHQMYPTSIQLSSCIVLCNQ